MQKRVSLLLLRRELQIGKINDRDNLIKQTLNTAKTIAMVGASTKRGEAVAKTRLKPSIIVMKYLLEFGYKVIPVNPFSKIREKK